MNRSSFRQGTMTETIGIFDLGELADTVETIGTNGIGTLMTAEKSLTTVTILFELTPRIVTHGASNPMH